MERRNSSTFSKVSRFSYTAQINSDRAIALFFFYIYGIYGFNKINPTWENLDGKVFYIGSQTVIHLSILLVFIYQIRFLSKKAEKKVCITINKFQIISFFLFFILYSYLNSSPLKLDLYGDETSYAKYSYLHFEKITNFVLSRNENLEDFKLGALIQIVGLLTLIIFLVVIFYLMKLPIKNFYYSLFVLTIIFRLLNLEFFKFEDENSQPFLLIYQLFISIFGLSSFSFRLGTIFLFTTFSVVLLNEINKQLKNPIKSLIVSISFLTTPIILTMSTKIDHAMFTFFACCFVLLWWLDGWKKSILNRKVFILSSIYLSLTSLIIIVGVVITQALNSYRTKKLRPLQINLNRLGILIYALPFLTLHFFRIVKSIHITNQIKSEENPSLIDKISLTWKGIHSFADHHIIIIIIIGVISFVFTKQNKFNLIFLLLVFLAFASLTAPGALGWNRYYLQWLVPFVLLIYVKLSKSRKFISALMSLLIALSAMNVYLFKSFSNNFANFDKFVIQENWNIGSSNIQPRNVIWPGTYYQESLDATKTQISKSRCLMIGNFWSAVPETLSGYSAKLIRDLGPYYELNRKTLDQLMFYNNDSEEIDLSNIDCLYNVAAVNKSQLNNYLISRGWISTNSQENETNYRFYILQKPTPSG